MVQVRWKGLLESEDTLEPFLKVNEDVLLLLLMLFARKNTPTDVAAEARRNIHLQECEYVIM